MRTVKCFTDHYNIRQGAPTPTTVVNEASQSSGWKLKPYIAFWLSVSAAGSFILPGWLPSSVYMYQDAPMTMWQGVTQYLPSDASTWLFVEAVGKLILND